MVFTGIVEGTGIVTDIVHSKNLSELTVQTSTEFCQGIKIGASVCVDGVWDRHRCHLSCMILCRTFEQNFFYYTISSLLAVMFVPHTISVSSFTFSLLNESMSEEYTAMYTPQHIKAISAAARAHQIKPNASLKAFSMTDTTRWNVQKNKYSATAWSTRSNSTGPSTQERRWRLRICLRMGWKRSSGIQLR